MIEDKLLNYLQNISKSVWMLGDVMDDDIFSKKGRVHDWRNHVPESIERIWSVLDEEQRLLVVMTAELGATYEEWN